ncbi:hypothetical protein CRI93_09525 [Longimonas halophila]|uniref:Glycosyl transferase family 1 domain-containing protein n=1 Tax=Longimonas halophila TaxID=1469170 RepID=A0A2H3P4C9_9BACT|nr:glycosyltransferase [Longimonas halophila]PEN06512.1 hypothetical protein CRI93_09525 [Longimonas halophila]
MPTRIALVVPDLSTSGGVSTVAHFLTEVVRESSAFEVDLFSVALGSSDRASVQLRSPSTWTTGVQVLPETKHELSYSHVGAAVSEVEYFRYQPRAALTRRLNTYDLVQVVAGTPAWTHLCRDVHVPVALQVATLTREERQSALSSSIHPIALWRQLMARITDRLDHTALSHADVVFVENQWMYDHLTEYLPDEQVVFAPPGVDTERFTPGDVPSQRSYILSVGRFADARKNVPLLFDAYAQYRQTAAHPLPLVLAGRTAPPPDAWAQAEKLGIRDAVTFEEDVPADALPALYREAALYVVSADEEGLGLTILEAMASGCPVVSTNCGGPSTSVVEGETGHLTPVGDADALAKAMTDVLSDAERTDAMGQAGRKRAASVFSKESTGQRFLDVYKQLVSP